jgi:hypothetical protein
MFKSEAQQCKAIELLLSSVGLQYQYLWTARGPTEQACKLLERSPLSLGDQLLLRGAFDLWNGAGKVLLCDDLLGALDPARSLMLLLLVMAVNSGGSAVDEWIARGQAQAG